MRALPLALALMTAGCGRYFPPKRDMSRLLTAREVAGRWVMTEASAALLMWDGLPGNQGGGVVTFHADGTLAFDTAVDDGGRRPRQLAGRGTWVLLHDTTGGSNLTHRNVVRLDLPDRVIHLAADERDGHVVLWKSYGDPDEWEFIEHVTASP